MQRVVDLIDSLNERLGHAVSWLTTLLVVLISIDVFVRYFLRTSAAWVMELEWHLFGLIFLVGAGYAFRHDRHVRVDLFYANFRARDQALVNLVGNLLFLLPWSALIMYASWFYALEAYYDGEASPNPGGLAYVYPIKFAIPLGFLLLFLQGVADTLRSYLLYRSEQAADNH